MLRLLLNLEESPDSLCLMNCAGDSVFNCVSVQLTTKQIYGIIET